MGEGFEGKTWLTKLNDGYYPGDLRFDPLGLKPKDDKEFENMVNKELNNGRLAMIAAMGMILIWKASRLCSICCLSSSEWGTSWACSSFTLFWSSPSAPRSSGAGRSSAPQSSGLL